MNKHVFLAAAVAALMAGCSSVPLNDVPVEDRTASTLGPGGAGGGGSGTQSTVTPVMAEPTGSAGQGPANVARIIYFDYDSNSIKPQYQSLVEAHARFLKSGGGKHVVVEGHTDDRGGREYNLALGQRRAEAVRRALNLLGVADSQVEAVSFGKEKAAVPGGDENAWAQNRRAEIVYR
ncbi:peptidoglycan-associated lipoprotein Pal [Ramlibacter sp.]|uniref:peptidoglycan-associated lipoprotein Pal n=1 Tax=Ramlibacter sp. TaxID=1917967 RepID=UPI0018163F91|nr:peptidoglycan-associated lipoprotein Pal [Ramlibacter sp.]MBA2676006.1 peptidoglycan-associated lipoprotein Pal [Ramlibacter sp.]